MTMETNMPSDQNLALYVASYADSESATQDFQALKDAEGSDLAIVADDYDKLQKALDKSGDEIGDAIDS
jgi:hypothetical protein